MKICYFGIYNPEWGRSRTYMKGLRELGHEVVECRDTSPGFLKYIKLFQKHWEVRNSYNSMIVGYPGHGIVWFAKLISKKPVIFDALCTLYEGVVLSRGQHKNSLKRFYIKFIDWISVKCADVVLVETECQRKFFEKRFGQNDKYKVMYSGCEDEIFFVDPKVHKKEKFTAIFRGKFLPEAGVTYILKAAHILKDKEINFLIIGNGWLQKEVEKEIEGLGLNNVEIVTRHVSDVEKREMMFSSHVSLGQFENHERLTRTIPHKCFESLALGLPYITARTEPVLEILKEGETCLFVRPADPQDLADKIMQLKNNPKMLSRMSQNELALFQSRFMPRVLAKQIIEIVQ